MSFQLLCVIISYPKRGQKIKYNNGIYIYIYTVILCNPRFRIYSFYEYCNDHQTKNYINLCENAVGVGSAWFFRFITNFS